MRRSHQVAASIECDFERARLRAGLSFDQLILSRAVGDGPVLTREPASVAPPIALQPLHGATLREAYEAYMNDPTHDWSPRTRLAYDTTRRLVLAVLGDDTPMRSITRARCREFVEVLQWLPRNASKLHPGVPPVEIAIKAKAMGRTDLISASNINTYLNKLCGVFNWALKEQMIDRNPALGLRMPDPTLRRDKRLPFTSGQLRTIFSAPLYAGCQDDGHGYALPGHNRPQNARFWIPLIGLFCGLRLNEACQLDVADIKVIEKIACIAITASSETGRSDKRLKTASSERLVPVHPELLMLGFMEFVAQRRRAAELKLFGEVAMGVTGYRSAAFSAWFARFATKSGASSPKTCYHSFRHVFRDALREARVERDIALALGGWSRSGGSGGSSSVSDAYGSGYRVVTLFKAISQVRYPDLDLTHLHDRCIIQRGLLYES